MIRSPRVAMVVALVAALVGCAAPEVTPTTAVVPASTPAPALAQPAADPGYVGVVIPAAAVDLAPTYDGEIERIAVAVGQWVEAGAEVARFDPAAAREALAIAQAEVRVAQGEAAQASAMARHAGRRLATARVLVEQGISPAHEIDDAQAERARHGAASSSAAGRIAGAKARVLQLERELAQTSLVAPFRGQISLVYREAGAQAGPSKPVVRLVDTSSSFVRFAVPPVDVAAFRAGAAVEVVLDGVGVTLAATVRDVAPEVDPPSGKIFVEAQIAAASVPYARPHSPASVRLAGSP